MGAMLIGVFLGIFVQPLMYLVVPLLLLIDPESRGYFNEFLQEIALKFQDVDWSALLAEFMRQFQAR